MERWGAWSPGSLAVAALAGAALGLVCIGGAFAAARARKAAWSAALALLAVLVLPASGLFGTLCIGLRGYRALTREETAARVEVNPIAAQRFEVRFEFPDGRRSSYTLAGDELYVDAHVLKWKWVANWFGLHTHYELDRVAGRYGDLEDERSRPRTVHSLAPARRIDLFRLVRSHARFAPLVDAEYGSASFVPADRPVSYDLRVSTTGLLFRERNRL
jgi:hypothetical protein